MSSFYPLAAASPVVRGLGLEEHGLAWSHAPAVLGHFDPASQRWATLHRDREVTAAGSGRPAPRRRRGLAGAVRAPGTWSGTPSSARCCRRSRRCAAGSPPRSPYAGAGGLDLVRTLLTPASDAGPRAVRRRGGRACCIAGNASHADIPLDAPGSGLMAVLLAMLGQTVGWPVPAGRGRRARRGARAPPGVPGRHAALRGRGRRDRGRPGPGPRRAARRRRADQGAGPCSPTWRRRASTAVWCAPRTCRRAPLRRMQDFQMDPVDDQGRLGALRAGAVGGRRRRTRRAPCTSPTPSPS